MRIRFIKSVRSMQGSFAAGSVADISENSAMEYLRAGLAMQDKSLDGPPENKEALGSNMYRCSKCQMAHKLDSKIGNRHLKYKE